MVCDSGIFILNRLCCKFFKKNGKMLFNINLTKEGSALSILYSNWETDFYKAKIIYISTLYNITISICMFEIIKFIYKITNEDKYIKLF